MAAGLFLFFPSIWLVSSSLAFTEPLMVLCAVSAFSAFRRGNLWESSIWLGCASVTQKHAILMLPILAITHLATQGWRRLPSLAPLLFSLVPLAGLQAYLYFNFGDPLANLGEAQKAFAGPVLDWPLATLVAGTLSPTQLFEGHFWLRKAMILLSTLFYTGILISVLRRRERRQRALLIWLACMFAFSSSLAGPWGYLGFPRYMLLGAPAALLLFSDRCRMPAPSLRARVAVASVLASLVFATALTDVAAATKFCERVWSPVYYQQLAPLLR